MTRAVLVGLCAVALGTAADGRALVFEQEVQPILSSYCLTCHGKSSPERGLDLRSARSLFRGSFSGPVVVKGDAEASLLYRKLARGQMPPPAFKSVVPEQDVETIRRWIDQGAAAEDPEGVPELAQHQLAYYRERIQPLFVERCSACHGGSTPQAGLDLRSLPGLLRGGLRGPVVLEGFSEKSALVRQIADGAMPPQGAGGPLSPDEVDLVRDWIDRGHFADYVEVGRLLDRSFTEAEAPPVTDADRSHWAFVPPESGAPPPAAAGTPARTPIDAFIVSELDKQGLTLSGPASRRTLVRRAYFDLWGLPPTPAQVADFLADERPGSYDRLLDRLLESPLYGQRWARFWLDAAGYVDTLGKDFQADRVSLAPGMWRYRDYVVDSFNADKPWDRFLTEQLAGDELHDWRNADRHTPEMLESLVATGYLRTVLDATNEDISDRPADRYDTLFALIDKVSRSAIGLTLTCARCHSHKYDPIPQRDYYRFLALFSAAYNPSDWIQPKNRLLHTISRAEKERVDRHNESVDAEVDRLRSRFDLLAAPYRDEVRESKLDEVPAVIRDDVRAAVLATAGDRTEIQDYLARKFGQQVAVGDREVLDLAAEAERDKMQRILGDIETWRGYRSEPQQIQALWDGEGRPLIRLLQRGSVESPGPRVRPGFLAVLCAAGENCLADPSPTRMGETSGLRLALAEWLVDPRHPLTARVIVNRIWQHHFGEGIVSTADDFGRNGAPPSNQALLDWLAVDFVRHGWKAKRLHKLIMTSSVYRQSSRRGDNPRSGQAAVRDPDNRLLWRMPLRRLDAEALRDSILSVAGRLDTSLGGPPVELESRPDGLQVATGQGAVRRSIYLLARRTWPSTFLGAFDFPSIDTTCIRRVPSATPLQSLTLMNSEFALENAAAAARVISRMAADSPAERPAALAESAYRLILGRRPTAEESRLARDQLDAQRQLHARANSVASEALEKAVERLAHALISSNEFLYVD